MLRYRMEGTEYALVDEENRIHWAGPEIAVAFSYDQDDEKGMRGTLHKHGSPDLVQAWFGKTVAKYRAGGSADLASQIHVVSGPIPLEELNKMIDISGYVGIWYECNIEEEYHGGICRAGEAV